MHEFDDARDLLKELENKLFEVNKLIQNKRKEYADKEVEIKEEIEVLEEIAAEREELIEILKNCSVDICKYKTAFEDIRKRYTNQIQEHITKQDFHFFLCFREDYAKDGKTAIDSHLELIHKGGFCWWGKFFEQRKKGGGTKDLEPFGESIKIDGNSNVAKTIQARIRKRVENRKPVYLYNYNPNPPNIKLYVCNVVDFYYGERVIPYESNSNEIPPQCAYIPRYYFHKREGNCSSCKKIDHSKCKPGYTCNFWFKVDKMREIENVEEEFVNLRNCFTDDSINFSIPIFYPLLVSQNNERFYFPEDVEPIRHKTEYAFDIPKKEKGHTKTEKVKKLFDDLNKACGQSFAGVHSIDCVRGFSGKPEIRRSRKDDEILIVLPDAYRTDGKAMRFKIRLDKKTKAEQKKKVEEMIVDHLN
jgi:hypothetical protein